MGRLERFASLAGRPVQPVERTDRAGEPSAGSTEDPVDVRVGELAVQLALGVKLPSPGLEPIEAVRVHPPEVVGVKILAPLAEVDASISPPDPLLRRRRSSRRRRGIQAQAQAQAQPSRIAPDPRAEEPRLVWSRRDGPFDGLDQAPFAAETF